MQRLFEIICISTILGITILFVAQSLTYFEPYRQKITTAAEFNAYVNFLQLVIEVTSVKQDEIRYCSCLESWF